MATGVDLHRSTLTSPTTSASKAGSNALSVVSMDKVKNPMKYIKFI